MKLLAAIVLALIAGESTVINCDQCVANGFQYLILLDWDKVCVQTTSGYKIKFRISTAAQCKRAELFLRRRQDATTTQLDTSTIMTQPETRTTEPVTTPEASLTLSTIGRVWDPNLIFTRQSPTTTTNPEKPALVIKLNTILRSTPAFTSTQATTTTSTTRVQESAKDRGSLFKSTQVTTTTQEAVEGIRTTKSHNHVFTRLAKTFPLVTESTLQDIVTTTTLPLTTIATLPRMPRDIQEISNTESTTSNSHMPANSTSGLATSSPFTVIERESSSTATTTVPSEVPLNYTSSRVPSYEELNAKAWRAVLRSYTLVDRMERTFHNISAPLHMYLQSSPLYKIINNTTYLS